MPDIGRWTQIDPLFNDLKFAHDNLDVDPDDDEEVYMAIINDLEIGGGIYNTDNLNPYGYGYNNPVSFDDPDGRCPSCVWGAIIGAGIDYGLQVAGNLAEGKELGDALTDVDGTSILISAGVGALSGGIASISKLQKADKVVKIVTRTTRSGDKGGRFISKSGKIKDITKERVKVFKPAPKNPSGKPNQVNFKKSPKEVPKGSKVLKTDPKKRTPTKKEIKTLKNAKDTP